MNSTRLWTTTSTNKSFSCLSFLPPRRATPTIRRQNARYLCGIQRRKSLTAVSGTLGSEVKPTLRSRAISTTTDTTSVMASSFGRMAGNQFGVYREIPAIATYFISFVAFSSVTTEYHKGDMYASKQNVYRMKWCSMR